MHEECAADVLVDSFGILSNDHADHPIEQRTINAERLMEVIGLFDSLTQEEARDMISG